jgi:predicted Fe-Mo cluster-binding NifX family protein
MADDIKVRLEAEPFFGLTQLGIAADCLCVLTPYTKSQISTMNRMRFFLGEALWWAVGQLNASNSTTASQVLQHCVRGDVLNKVIKSLLQALQAALISCPRKNSTLYQQSVWEILRSTSQWQPDVICQACTTLMSFAFVDVDIQDAQTVLRLAAQHDDMCTRLKAWELLQKIRNTKKNLVLVGNYTEVAVGILESATSKALSTSTSETSTSESSTSKTSTFKTSTSETSSKHFKNLFAAAKAVLKTTFVGPVLFVKAGGVRAWRRLQKTTQSLWPRHST